MKGFTASIVRRSGSYAVVINLRRDPTTGKRRQEWHSGYRTRNEAEKARTKKLHDLNSGSYVAEHDQTLAEYMAEWLDASARRVRPSTLDSYRSYVARHITGKPIGQVRLQGLGPADLNSLYGVLMATGRANGKGGLSARSVRYLHAIIRRALQDAVRWGKLSRNVATLADPPSARQARPPEMKVWTGEQLAAFLDATGDDRLHALWLLAATTGARRGELAGARWADLDLDTGRWSIRRTLVNVGGKLAWSTPKTDSGKRQVMLDSHTVAELRQHKARQGVERALMGDGYEDNDLAFAWPDGRPIDPNWITARFRTLVDATNLPGIRLHDLRHTHASIGLQLGIHPAVMADRLGHADPALTLRVYSHLLPTVSETAAALVANHVLGASGAAAR